MFACFHSVLVQFIPSDDPEQEGKKVTSYKIMYTKQDPSLEDAQWEEVIQSIDQSINQ
jgi:hypothetical protein